MQNVIYLSNAINGKVYRHVFIPGSLDRFIDSNESQTSLCFWLGIDGDQES